MGGDRGGLNYYFMALEEKIMTDLKAAMLAKDEKSLRSLRAIKAAIIIAKTSEGAGGVLKEEDEIKLLQKLVKQRKDSLEIFEKQNRPDLAEKEKEEIEVIEKFLPKQKTFKNENGSHFFRFELPFPNCLLTVVA